MRSFEHVRQNDGVVCLRKIVRHSVVAGLVLSLQGVTGGPKHKDRVGVARPFVLESWDNWRIAIEGEQVEIGSSYSTIRFSLRIASQKAVGLASQVVVPCRRPRLGRFLAGHWRNTMWRRGEWPNGPTCGLGAASEKSEGEDKS